MRPRLFPSLLLACVMAATAAKAQDIVAQYEAAFDSFAIGNDFGDPDAAAAAIEALLPQLRGKWFPISALAGNQRDLDDVPLGRVCNYITFELVPGARFSFDFVRRGRTDAPPMTFRYSYAGLATFQRSFDEAEFLSMTGMEGRESLPTGIFLHQPGLDRVAMFHPSHDILVFVTNAGGIEMYGRCP